MFNPQPKPEKTPKKQKKRINHISKRRMDELAEYTLVRRKWLDQHDKCQVCAYTETLEVHHIKDKENEHLNDTKYFMTVCRHCHNKIHDNVEWAKSKGYLINRTL